MSRKLELFAYTPLFASLAASFWLFARLPENFVSHWNAAGDPDGSLPKFAGAFLVPGMMLFFLVLRWTLTRIDPLRKNIRSFQREYDLFWLALSAFLAYVHGTVLAWNLGVRFELARWLAPAFAGFWYALGTVIARARRNWSIGIRTPWTLSSDDVWNKTHAFGSKLFKAAACIALAGFFLPVAWAAWSIAVPALLASFSSIAYSYAVWKRLQPPVG